MAQSQSVSGPIVIHMGRLGDTVLLGTLLSLLHARYRQRCRLISARPWCTAVFDGHPDVAQILALERHGSFFLGLDGWRALRLLRREREAPVYICEAEPRRLARVRRLLALAGVEPGRCVFLVEQRFAPDIHWAERFGVFGRLTPPALRRAGATPPAAATDAPLGRTAWLHISAAEHAACAAYVAQRGWSGRPIILVQPGNRRTMRPRRIRAAPVDSKAWPVERWVALLQRLQGSMPDAVLVLCGARREAAMLKRIRAAAALPAVETAAIPLRLLFALCGQAFGMVSVDSGPAHAAAAVGLPLVVLFGDYSQQQWLPRSSTGAPVLGLGGPPASRQLLDLSVDAVYDRWLELLALLGQRRSGDLPPDPAAGAVPSAQAAVASAQL